VSETYNCYLKVNYIMVTKVVLVSFAETMATKNRMLNGYHLRRRSIPPRPRNNAKLVIPKTLMNINEPMKSQRLMKRFVARMMENETSKVSL